MRFAVATAAVAGLAGVAVADGGWGNHEGSWGSSAAPNATATSAASEVWVTDVVTAFTTYCPYATQLTHGGSTYTVSSATTLTITNCPCTITRPASSAWTGSWGSSSESSASPVTESSSVWTSQSWSSESASVSPVTTAYSSAVWTSPVSPITTSAPYPSGNATWTATASSYSTSSSPAAATYTGAASQLSVGGGLLALFGLVAAL